MKKVKLNLVGLDGNIYYLLGMFEKQAKKENWTESEINIIEDKVLNSESYEEALSILIDVCE